MNENTSDIRHNAGNKQPVRIDDWVAANQPKLHPTRRKVLQAVSRLTGDQEWVSSREVREEVGVSQQLLNRHLRALEADGLVALENPGPGLPLNVRATPAGGRVADMKPRAREPQPPVAAGPEPSPKVRPEPAPQARPEPSESPALDSLSRQLYRLLSQRYPDLTPVELEALVGKAAKLAKSRKAEAPARTAPRQSAPAPSPVPPRPQAAAAARSGDMNDLSRGEAGRRDAWFRPAGDYPPQLNQAETALESRLRGTANPVYQEMPWYERTRNFSDIWERIRRRRLGLLTNYFTNFQPRWERPDWADFNLGRRQADARGADYQQWVQAVFEQADQNRQDDAPPSMLHGNDAVEAYMATRTAEVRKPDRILSRPAPYTADTFDLANPEHTAYAEALLEEIAGLAKAIYGDEPEGPLRLAMEAVNRGNLPLRALDLRPRWKEQAFNALARQKPAQARAAAQPADAEATAQEPQYQSGIDDNGPQPPGIII